MQTLEIVFLLIIMTLYHKIQRPMTGGGDPVAENAWVLGDIRIRASHVRLALIL
jgi:hypothetical protein